MSIFHTFIALVLGLTAVGVFFSLALSILLNVRVGERFRDGLSKQLKAERLDAMLDGLGVEQSAFLHEQGVVDIHKQIWNCQACDNKESCDETVKEGAELAVENIGFCANESQLRNLLSTNEHALGPAKAA